ncbi:low molecular weight phosphotyrosine protein phosphatase [Stakelama sp. CBK3Z-3]|uniref:protein-tyrosine-phosphatase n=1 Tax=Stakelama flava TaxID=2860338 RepID=A0ABS6XGF4_9SPHN|nr:low molecular weight protein-tyrosine-phosphatase [Stakelama flava]MBW4329291.1 low molecular weight phosphotyrosine protein phosphatase [Stakelama flava]
MNQRPTILFVCLGNICRSPMAEGALRARAQAAGLDLIVDSAGTGGWHVGEPPDERAQAETLNHGVDISTLRGRQVAPVDFARFTHIFALDDENLANLRRFAPETHDAHLGLLLDMVPGLEGQPVADPYYGGADGFARTWQQVDAAAAALVERFTG